jgi:hypothetical protein
MLGFWLLLMRFRQRYERRIPFRLHLVVSQAKACRCHASGPFGRTGPASVDAVDPADVIRRGALVFLLPRWCHGEHACGRRWAATEASFYEGRAARFQDLLVELGCWIYA